MKKLKFALIGAMTLIAGCAMVAQAAPGKTSPAEILLNCQLKGKVYTHKLDYVLNKVTPKQISQVYFIKNKSSMNLVIDHVAKEAGAKAGWASSLSRGKWSALAVSQTSFSLSCSITSHNQYSQGDCAKLVSICQPAQGATINSDSSYWVTENQRWHDFIRIMQKKGVVAGKIA